MEIWVAALEWLEGSSLGRAMRESGPWTYALVNLAHVVALSTLFGSVLLLDLRLLGVWRRAPLDAIASAASSLAAAGFALAVPTGIALLATQATEYAGNPFLPVKLMSIAAALVNAVASRRNGAWRALGTRELAVQERRRLAYAGGISLVCSITAISAGRLIAYW